MASPYTPEFRAKVSQEYLDGGSYPSLAEKYNIEKQHYNNGLPNTRFTELLRLSNLPGMPHILQILKRCVWMRFCQGKGVSTMSLQSTTYLHGRYSGAGLCVIMPIENLRTIVQKGRSIWQEQEERQPSGNEEKLLHIAWSITVIIKELRISIKFPTARFIPG